VRPRPLLAAAILVAIPLIPFMAAAALGPRYGGELTIGVVDLPSSVEPSLADSAGARLIAGLVHEGLVGVDAEGLPTPALARGWSTGAGGREWTLTLRDGLVFHDGRPLTSADALRSLRRFLRGPGTAAAQFAAALEGGERYRSRGSDEVAGLVAPDPGHLVLRLREPRARPLAPLASAAAAITGAEGAACGPFVPTVQIAGRRLGLTAFGAHVRGRPFLDRLSVRKVQDLEALRSDLQTGAIDVALGAPGPPSPLAATLLLVLDPRQRPFQNASLRSAVAHAVNRADLVRYFLPGGEPAASLLTPALLAPVEAPPAAAVAAASGSAVMVVARDVPPLVSQRVVASLGAAGLRVDVRPADPGEARATGAAARLLLWSPEVPEAGLALEELAALVPPPAEALEALDAARREPGLDRRRALLLRADAALRSQDVLVPLAAAPVACATRRGVHGLKVDLGGRVALEDAWVEP
jgi:MarR-like DNA-binding transcriptional regulator SgrR of sgrS sRNA